MSYGGLRGGVGFSLVNMIPIAVGKLCLMYVHCTAENSLETVLHSSSCAE